MVGRNHVLQEDTLPPNFRCEESAWSPAAAGDKGLLLLMLYDKAIHCMEEAVQLIEAGDMLGKGEKLIQAQDIVLELMDALDHRAGGIAGNLERLYMYVYRRLIRGNMRVDAEAIGEARRVMDNLYLAWQRIILDRDSALTPVWSAA
jgi:flagellar protein FliS